MQSIKRELDILNNLFLHERVEMLFNFWGDLTDHILLKVNF